jgi:Fe-S-cluster containining protein
MYTEQYCEKLEDGKCTIYDSRPLVCRSYPFRYVQMSRGRVYYEFAPECPGIEETIEGSNTRKRFPEIYTAEEIGLSMTHFYKTKSFKWEFDEQKGKWSPWKPNI